MWAIAVCSGKSVPAEQAPTTGSALPTSGHASRGGVGRGAKGGYLH